MCSVRNVIPKWKVKTKLKVALYVLTWLKESKIKQAKNASILTIPITFSKLSFLSTCNVYQAWKFLSPREMNVSLRNYDPARAFSSSLLRAIIAHNHLRFFKIFSNFVHFRPNVQRFCPFLSFFNIFSPPFLALFLKNSTHALTF